MSTHPAIDAATADDAGHFRARARDERRRVRLAANDRSRRVHREMAEHYEAVARMLERGPAGERRSLARSLRHMLRRFGAD